MEHTLNEHHELRTEYKTSEKAFRILMVLVWTRQTFLSFLSVLLRSVPILGLIADYSIMGAIIISAVIALPYFSRRIRVVDLFIYIMAVGIVLSTRILYKENYVFLQPELQEIIVKVLPLYLLGVVYSHELCKKYLFYSSFGGVLAFWAYQMYNLSLGRDLEHDDMHPAYLILPSVVYLIYWSFERKNPLSIITAALGGLLLLSYGARGPVFVAVVFTSYYVISFVFRSSSIILKMITILVVVSAVYLIISGEELARMAQYLKEKFEGIGLSTRVFDLFLEGEIDKDSGRNELYDIVKNSISQNKVFGSGIMGDRVALDDRYVHHLIYEVWCHFGIIFGTGLLVVFLFVPVKTMFIAPDADIRNFVIMLFCISVVKLFMSSSYLYEQYLYFLVGVCFAISRQRRSYRYNLQ